MAPRKPKKLSNTARAQAVRRLQRSGHTPEQIAEQLAGRFDLNPKSPLGGRPVSAETAKRRAQIRRWRSQKTPVPWAEITKRLGMSRSRVLVIARGPKHGVAVNPKLEAITYDCHACGSSFVSRSKELPSMCSACTSWEWDTGATKQATGS